MADGITSQAGYFEILRDNPNFRRLWLGDVVSLLGDWFNTIAIYALIHKLTGSPFALGLVFVTKMLPFALASPVAGLIADRFDRRRLMLTADLLRAVIVLGFLFVTEAGYLPLLYVLTVLQVTVGAVFIPARSASIPNITSERELLTANTIASASWSVLLALGAALGGLATELLGLRAVFLIDSLTYLVSAQFIYRTVIPQQTAKVRTRGRILRRAAEEIVAGWQQLIRNPSIGRISMAKATWAAGGGALVYMLTLLGEELSPYAPGIGIGIMFAARGVGTGIGPIIGRRYFRDQRQWPLILGICTLLSGVFYQAVGHLPVTYGLVALIVVAHAFSGVNWVFSTVLLQRRTEDIFRGRVFATEWLFLTLVDTLTIISASLLLEYQFLDLSGGIQMFAAIQILSGALWIMVVAPREARHSLSG